MHVQGARVIASGSALLSIGSFGVDILVKVVTGATSFDEYPPGAGILFSVSQYLSVGSSFPVRITRHLVSKSGTGDWVGLVRVGQPSEMVGSFLLDVDALPSTSFDKDGNLAFQWPSDCTPRSPGTSVVL